MKTQLEQDKLGLVQKTGVFPNKRPVKEQEAKSEYDLQAEQFMKKTGTEIKIKLIKCGLYFNDDKEERNIYRITLKRKDNKISFRYGDSVNNTQEGLKPSAYDILACCGSESYDYADFEDFCESLGYEEDSRKAEKIYKTYDKQQKQLSRLYTEEELNLLREIR